MPSLAIHAGRALTPHEEISDAVVLVEDGKIARIGRRDEIEVPAGAKEVLARDTTLIPGFVDIHIHGAGGHDVMSSTEEALTTVAKTVARHGTTSLVATTVTAPPDETRRCLEDIARYIASPANTDEPATPTAEIVGKIGRAHV